MMHFIVRYPDYVPGTLDLSCEQFEADARMAMAVKLYELRRISSSVAAEMANVDRATFLLNLHLFDASVRDVTDDELLADLKNNPR